MKTPLVREKLTLRLPPTLHRSLKAVAVDDGRSLNAEIVQRLRQSLEGSSNRTRAEESTTPW
jgi:predicted HicB family RNase H-like nuclease